VFRCSQHFRVSIPTTNGMLPFHLIPPKKKLTYSQSCYADCVGEDRVSAELLSEHDCRTANAYDKGISTVNDVWTTPSPNAAEATPTDATTTTPPTSTSEPTKSFGEEKAATSKGAAAPRSVGSWLALVGIGLGVAF
jgi:hypothetical protein